MPKLILEFNLPEEREEAACAQSGGLYSSALNDIQNYARSLRKYDDRDSIPKDEIVDKLYELTSDYIE